jgi:hypothetical protein
MTFSYQTAKFISNVVFMCTEVSEKMVATRKGAKLDDEDLRNLLNNTSEDGDEDNNYSDSSDGWVNTVQSDSDADSTSGDDVNDNEVEEVMVDGWPATGKEWAAFPFIANSGVQVNMNNIILEHHVDIIKYYRMSVCTQQINVSSHIHFTTRLCVIYWVTCFKLIWSISQPLSIFIDHSMMMCNKCEVVLGEQRKLPFIYFSSVG